MPAYYETFERLKVVDCTDQRSFLFFHAFLWFLSMSLLASVELAFAANGPLAQSLASYTPRMGQSMMAQQVAQTLQDGGALVVEAGTGIGKTYAYLVPVLLSGQRVLVSTATKTLQDQLYGRDIPRLMSALGVVLRVALLKGRSSYLCDQRLHRARQDAVLTPADWHTLARVEQWAQFTQQGDLAELSGLDEDSDVVEWVTSTRDNCWGARCPQLHRCHVHKARRNAMDADVVVVNHHLFFADLEVRESGVAELLPTVQAVILDEAHQLNTIGVQFLGRQWGTAQVQSLGRDLLKSGTQLARGWVDWPGLLHALQEAMQMVIAATEDSQAPAIHALQRVMYSVVAALEMVAATSPEFVQLLARAEHLLQSVVIFSEPPAADVVRWVDKSVSHCQFMEAPLHIAEAMQRKTGWGLSRESAQQAWIFTSATLGLDQKLSSFVEMCGLQHAQVLQIPSPFDYANQAALYLPDDMPLPHGAAHSQAVAQLVADAAQVLGGRTLVLTTTLRAMHAIAAHLRKSAVPDSKIVVLLQGEMPKRKLLQLFSAGAQAYILVASASFWDGVDLPGCALQLVVMDKIPFEPPDDPLVQARAKSVELGGKSAFMHYHLPQAALALKQGAGRLIRSETDQGVLVVCDVRLQHKGYGRKLLAALPAMRRLHTSEDFQCALQALTKLSTMD